MSYGDIEPTMVGGTRSTAQLAVMQGPWSGKQFSLDQASLIIGRAPECDIVLDDKEVSRRHTRLFWRSSQLMIEDLGSANGTLINGSPITGAHPIGPSDQIEIGASILQAQGVLPPAAVPAQQEIIIPPSPAPQPQMQAAPVAAPQQQSSGVWLAVGGVIVVIILALIFVAAALWYFSSNQPGNLPEAAFVVPSNGAELIADVPIAVQASATDDEGVMRAELWIDGVLIGQQPSTSLQGDPILLLNLPWIPTVPGSHVLEIRAFDVNGQQNQTTLVTINVTAAVAQVTDTPLAEATATPTLLPTPTATLVDSSSGEQLPADTPTFTVTPQPTTATAPSLRTISGVNVRGGPGTAYPVLGGLNTGQEIRPLGRSADGAWWQIVYPPNSGGVGWVSGPYVEPNEQALGLPIISAPPPPATSTPTPTDTPVATQTPNPTATATQPSLPPDINFTADDTTLGAGGCTYLRWRVRNIKAYWVDGSPGIGDEGSQKVCDPPGTTTHILRVQKNDDSYKEYGVEITVSGTTIIPAPKLISPDNNKQFDYYPREVTFVWEPVNTHSGITYSIEVQYNGGSWTEYRKVNGLSGTTYTMDNFVGANPGRWRVWATHSTYGDGEKSDWRYFEFLQ